KLDKPAYAEGETAKLTITPPHAGEALITVEGDRLLWMKRMSLDADGATLDIPVSEAWRRHDLYVTAMVLRPGGKPSESGAGVTPARALGLVYLPLERGGRKLEVTLAAPRKMEPNRDLKVRVKVAGAADPGKAGQTAMLTLSAVDVGILNITRFASPDPFAFFFGKQRYGHDLHDIYGRLIEKMAGQKGRLKWGGDAAPRPAQSMPQKVRLVDLFSGPVALDDNGEAEISLPVPDFNGSLRLMAVASDGERFGMRDAEVTVAAPLIVELATPRFLSVGDRALLSLDVQNLAGEKQEVKIRVGNGDGLVIHEGERQFTLEDQEKKVLRIPIEAGAAFGLTEVEINIDSPSLKQTRRFGLEVQAATPRETILKRYAVAPGESVEIRDAELSGLFRQTVLSTLAVSDKVPIDVKSAVRGLLIYPYGCAEQTTSTAYPHVFVDEKAARRFGLKPNTAAQRADMLGKAIGRLAGMQAPNGGFSLWGNVNEYQYWLSAYVAHFLLDTREQGFDVPAEMEKKTVDFLLRSLQEGVAGLPSGPFAYNENSVWRDLRYAGSGRFGVLAYGAYVLARQGKAPLSTLRRMHEVREQAHSGLALVHLGLALKLMGDEPRALETIDAGLGKPRVSSSWWGDYGSQIRDSSMIYVLLKKHGVERPGREALVAQVAGLLESGRYLSTQEKLAVFLLGRDFAEQKTGEWSASLAAAGKEKTIGGRGMQFEPLSADDLAAGVTLRNTHAQRLFLELNLSGHPIEMPPARNDAFRLTRTWYTADGRLLPSGFAARALEVGESLIVRVKVKPRGRYANALIVDYVPAGVEIENVNLSQGEQNALSIDGIDIRQAMQDARIKHREFRDDRFVAALRIDREMNLFYRVRVVTPGRFVVPPTWAEDMYQPTVYGLSGGGWTITVTDGKE
ncbi:MAG: alpha-2-macroglobulin family protein, partial [Candidatus Accumulibacter sp.]|nr:alpha-2-macroglobulin family protein [Accumulibacter sp.]